MLLNRQRYKSLALLDKKFEDIPLMGELMWADPEDEAFDRCIANMWNGCIKDFRNKLYTVSHPMCELISKNSDAMHKVGADIAETYKNGEINGALFLPSHDSLVVYYFDRLVPKAEREPNEPAFHCKMAFCQSGKVVIMALVRFHVDDKGEMSMSATCNVSPVGNLESMQYASIIALEMLEIEMFLRYADVETVVIENGQYKDKNRKPLPVQNFSGYPIKYIDSRWIREIIRTEGFKVSGHFRLQPYKKDGEWTKKLIYIKEYQKNGYHSHARKEDKDATGERQAHGNDTQRYDN